ncbi:hypothetical protein Tco_0108982 [Tanacetum coccineum]
MFFVGGAWSDSEDGDEPQNDVTYIVDLQKDNGELLKFSHDFSKTYEKLLQEKCVLEKEHSKLFSKVNELELEVKKLDRSKEVIEPCQKCVELTQKVDSLKSNVSKLQDEALNFSKFKKSSIVLDNMLSCQKLSQDKEGLGFSKIDKNHFYSQTSKAYIVLNKETIRIEESLNVTFDESFPEPKSSPSVEDDSINELIVQDLNRSSLLQVNVSDKGYPKSIKEARGHLIEQVIAIRLSDLDYNNEALPYARVMTTLFEYLKNKYPNDASLMIEVDKVSPMSSPFTMESLEL